MKYEIDDLGIRIAIQGIEGAKKEYFDRTGENNQEMLASLANLTSLMDDIVKLQEKIEDVISASEKVIAEDEKTQYTEGIRRKCHVCGGKRGVYKTKRIPDPMRPAHPKDGGWYAEIDERYFIPCEKCKGKGYLKQEWV